MTREEILNQFQKYNWYHRIEVEEGLVTPGNEMDYHPDIWAMIEKAMDTINYRGKSVLDVGCRDGYFSFRAEKMGAEKIIGIDNDLSAGAIEFLIPHFKSKVEMHEANLYDLTPERFGKFNVVQFLGVLYHLRYPFWGLKKMVDLVDEGGHLIIESGMLMNTTLAEHELLFCPVDHDYDATSCTFMNQKALEVTLNSMGMEMIYSDTLTQKSPLKQTIKRSLKSSDPYRGRQMFIFRKAKVDKNMKDIVDYWDGTHNLHTTYEG